ncbi:ATP synthase subunit e, mitochondrial [Cloeon dipterum]|uniref:ATP synthase subunit e, mitochondrial n=1 Tax=Cloeon dipterum TaxID=197152 RepID=UPI00322036AC
MSTAVELPAPVRVSPLIKFGRWSLLTVGILYGMSRHRSLAKKEAALREVEAKRQAELAPKLAAEKARLSKQELDDLARAAGVTVTN